MTGLYNLQKISGSVMIGNVQNINCTYMGLIDVICVQRNGSMAKETWEIKVVPQLNHELFSFTSDMKDGWHDTILPVVSLFSLKSNNSTALTFQ